MSVRKLKEESELYQDIVMGNHLETSPKSDSSKLEMMFEWSYKYCDFQYLLKTDDDNFVNMRNLFQFLELHENSSSTGSYQGNQGVYIGRVHRSAPPVWDSSVSYHVTREEYSGSRYPPFASSMGCLLSHDAVRAMIPHFLREPFKLADVYAGMLALNAEVDAVDSPLFLYDADECMRYHENAVLVHFEQKNKRNAISCLKQNFYETLARQAQDDFVFHHYKKNKTFLDAARKHNHKVKIFGGHVDYRYFTTPNHENLHRPHHISQLISDFRCHTKPIKVVVMLLSHTENFERRQVVRNTWGNNKFTYANDDWRIFFTVARVKDMIHPL